MIRSLPITALPVALVLLVPSTGQDSWGSWGAIVPGSAGPSAAVAALGGPSNREAARIRAGAGLPPGVVPGPGPAARPGLAAPRRLQRRGPIRIQSREDAAALARRGTGSSLDPFVLADLALEGHGSAEPFGIFWSDPFATYHIRLENVRIEGWASAQIYVRTGTTLGVHHAEFRGADASGAVGIRIAGGSVLVEESTFTGLAGDGIQIVGDAPVRASVSDSRFDEEGGIWGAGSRGLHNLNRGGDVAIEVLRCDFDAPSMTAAVRPWRPAECRLEASRFATRIGFEEGNESSSGLLVFSCVFETSHEAIRGEGLLGWEVAYCEFRDNEAGRRLVRLTDSTDGRLHHSLLTKASGGPDDACVEAVDCHNLEFGHNWVTASPGAAFSLVRLGGSSRVHHSVGDGVRGRFVAWDGPTPGQGVVHDLWADLDRQPYRLAAPVALVETDTPAPERPGSGAVALASVPSRGQTSDRTGS